MILHELLSYMPESQDLAIFRGFKIQYIGPVEKCKDEELLNAVVSAIESNGVSITVKCI